jgi:hypothetical protein
MKRGEKVRSDRPHRLKFGFLLLFALLSACGIAGAAQYDPLLVDKELFKYDDTQFMTVYADIGFRWISAAKDTARAGKGPTLAGIQTLESLVRFDDKTRVLTELVMLLYSRGDSGEIGKEAFDALVETNTAALSLACGKPLVQEREDQSLVKANSRVWKIPAGSLRMEWSSTRESKAKKTEFRSEFIRVTLAPPINPKSPVWRKHATRFAASDHLTNNATGDKWIFDMPMVDQGQKGYCGPATAERIMRYFGHDVDQHEIAQVCLTEEGTNSQNFEEQMKRVCRKYTMRLNVYLSAMDVGFINSFIRDYTREGRKKGGSPTPKALEINPYQFWEYFDDLDKGQILRMRGEDRQGLKRFEGWVVDSIDKAEPLAWSVQLGIGIELGIPQTAGGHFRLIIGYNARTKEILYTDSWGPGHELKRMPLGEAWAKTFALYGIRP